MLLLILIIDDEIWLKSKNEYTLIIINYECSKLSLLSDSSEGVYGAQPIGIGVVTMTVRVVCQYDPLLRL